MAPTALVLVRTSVTTDARVLRHAELLAAEGFAPVVLGVVAGADRAAEERRGPVTILRVDLRARRPKPLDAPPGSTAAVPPASAPAAPMPSAGRTSDLRRRVSRSLATARFTRRALAEIRRRRPALVHCNDFNTMWAGVAARALGTAVVYDSHELWGERNGRFESRLYLWLAEWLFVRAADAVIVTSPGHGWALARRLHIARPVVVENVPRHVPPTSGPALVEPPVALYVGAVTTDRGLEDSIRALPAVPGLRLHIRGPAGEDVRARLLALARAEGVADRVALLDAVPAAELLAAMRREKAAFGIALIQPRTRSYALSLPNKLHEYPLAGLPVLGTDLPVIGPWVRERGIGAVVPPGDVDALAAAMRAMLEAERLAALREAVDRFASSEPWRGPDARLAAVHASVVSRRPRHG